MITIKNDQLFTDLQLGGKMSINIRKVTRCGQAVQAAADPHASHVVYIDGQAVHDVSRRDGKYWIREHGTPRSNPFRPLCKDNLTANVREYVLTGSRPVGGWK